jgi:hypothetical protein
MTLRRTWRVGGILTHLRPVGTAARLGVNYDLCKKPKKGILANMEILAKIEMLGNIGKLKSREEHQMIRFRSTRIALVALSLVVFAGNLSATRSTRSTAAHLLT